MKRTVTKKEPENMGAELFAAVDLLETTKNIPKAYITVAGAMRSLRLSG